MEFQDKTLKCIDCGQDFVFTAGEQLFFHDKQFKNEPKRCKACKTKRMGHVGAHSHGPSHHEHSGGHAKVETTALYTHIATNTIRAVMSPLERLSLKPKKDEPPA